MSDKLMLPTDGEWEIVAEAWRLLDSSNERLDSRRLYASLVEERGFTATYGSAASTLVRLRQKGWLGYTRGKARRGKLYYFKTPDNMQELMEALVAHRLHQLGDHVATLEVLRDRLTERLAALGAPSGSAPSAETSACGEKAPAHGPRRGGPLRGGSRQEAR